MWGHTRCCCFRIYVYEWACVCLILILWSTVVDNIGGRKVGAMFGCRCDVSAFDLRISMCRPSKIDDRCVDFRRSMCRPSVIDDRCVDLRRSTIDVSTFKYRCVNFRRSMCRPSDIDVSTFDGRCEIMLLHLLKTLIQ